MFVEREPDEADWFAVRAAARRVVKGPAPATSTPSVSLHSTPMLLRTGSSVSPAGEVANFPLSGMAASSVHSTPLLQPAPPLLQPAPPLLQPVQSAPPLLQPMQAAPPLLPPATSAAVLPPAAAPPAQQPPAAKKKHQKTGAYFSAKERRELELALSAAVGPALCVPELADRLAFVGRMLRSRLRDDGRAPIAYTAPLKVSPLHQERVNQMRNAFQAALIEVGVRRQQKGTRGGGASSEDDESYMKSTMTTTASGTTAEAEKSPVVAMTAAQRWLAARTVADNPHLPLLNEVADCIFQQALPPPRIPCATAATVTAKAMDKAQDRAVTRRLKMRLELATAATAAALAFAASAHANSDSGKTSSQVSSLAPSSQPSSTSTSPPSSSRPSGSSRNSYERSSEATAANVSESFRMAAALASAGGKADFPGGGRQSISVLGALSNAPPPILTSSCEEASCEASCEASSHTGTPNSTSLSSPNSPRSEGTAE